MFPRPFTESPWKRDYALVAEVSNRFRDVTSNFTGDRRQKTAKRAFCPIPLNLCSHRVRS